MNDLDFTDTDFDHMTVGELYALLREPGDGTDAFRRPYLENIPTDSLLKLVQVGRNLLVEAVLAAQTQGNEDFFEFADMYHGPLIDTVVKEVDQP